MKNQANLRREHELVRNNVAFYDFTMLVLEVSGKDARDYLDYIFVNDIKNLNPGRAVYTTMLNQEGIVLDDVIVFCSETDKFWITTAFIEEFTNWLNENKGDREVSFKDLSSESAIYAVQGPNSKEIVNSIAADNVDDLKPFGHKDTTINGINATISRTGFTGELGYELHINPNDMEAVATILKEKGVEEIAAEEVTIGSLPGEKGFITIDEFEGANPIELGLGWTVKLNKDFIGKEITAQYKENGPNRNLLGYTIEDENAEIKKGDVVKLNGKEVGYATKFTYGYTVEKYLGYAMVDSEAKIGDKVTIVTDAGEVEATLQKREF